MEISVKKPQIAGVWLDLVHIEGVLSALRSWGIWGYVRKPLLYAN